LDTSIAIEEGVDKSATPDSSSRFGTGRVGKMATAVSKMALYGTSVDIHQVCMVLVEESVLG
jgi:hypothetical protein